MLIKLFRHYSPNNHSPNNGLKRHRHRIYNRVNHVEQTADRQRDTVTEILKDIQNADAGVGKRDQNTEIQHAGQVHGCYKTGKLVRFCVFAADPAFFVVVTFIVPLIAIVRIRQIDR